jgi:hypothetical protein
MFSRYIQPLSTRVIYTGPHANLAEEELSKTQNKNKLMYNDANGEIQFLDYTFLDDIEEYPTMGDFPPIGDPAKMYLDQSQNRVYRWSGSQYFYAPHDVYSKAECDTQYYEKTDLYTKTETDTKYTIRGATNDMTNTELNNIQTLNVSNCLTANSTSLSLTKPIYAGWQNFDFVNAINNKILLDGANVRINSTLDLTGNTISNVNAIGSTECNSIYANSQFIYNTNTAFSNVLRVNEIQNGSNVPIISLGGDNAINCNGRNIIEIGNASMASIQNAGESRFRFGKTGHINFHGQNLSGGVLSVRYIDGERTDPEGTNGFSAGYFDLSGGQIKCQTTLNLQNTNIINVTSTKTDFIDNKAGQSRFFFKWWRYWMFRID